jgi:hypothetical protein
MLITQASPSRFCGDDEVVLELRENIQREDVPPIAQLSSFVRLACLSMVELVSLCVLPLYARCFCACACRHARGWHSREQRITGDYSDAMLFKLRHEPLRCARHLLGGLADGRLEVIIHFTGSHDYAAKLPGRSLAGTQHGTRRTHVPHAFRWEIVSAGYN